MEKTRKQKVLIVHNYYQIPGGEDTVVANEKKLLEENEHEVLLYTRSNSELQRLSKWQKLLLPFSLVFNLRTYREVRMLIRQEKIDIVHVHNTLSLISPSVYYAALSCKVPVVQTIHNFRLLCPGATFYRDGHICEDCVSKGLSCAVKHGCYRNSKLQTLACVICTKFHRMTGIYGKINYICLTAFNKEKLLQLNCPGKKKVIDPEKVYIKPNFTFDNAANVQNGHREYYLFIGRVEKIKGLDILIDAFAGLPNEKLVVAGTGSQLEEYKDKASENVCFAGFLNRAELLDCLMQAKAVIVPSKWYEGFPMTILEAYSMGIPVIASDIGNTGAVVEEGSTGYKFRTDSAESLVESICKLQIHPLDSKTIKNIFKQKYSAISNYKILCKIYSNVVNAGRSRISGEDQG